MAKYSKRVGTPYLQIRSTNRGTTPFSHDQADTVSELEYVREAR